MARPTRVPSGAPRGVTAIGVFLLFGTAMACIAGITLVRQGTVLDHMWALNPRAYRELEPLGKPVGLLFLLLAVTLAVASAGWFKRRRWGWLLVVVIIGMQVASNLLHILLGRLLEGVVGLAIAGPLFLYIIRPNMRGLFAVEPAKS